MVTFLDDQRAVYGVEPICSVLPIAPSTYFEQKAREVDPRRLPGRLARERELRLEIERVWKENQSVYGARKVWKRLRREGFEGARCTVERLMAEMGPIRIRPFPSLARMPLIGTSSYPQDWRDLLQDFQRAL
jgi:putative transposase